jgi:transposase
MFHRSTRRCPGRKRGGHADVELLALYGVGVDTAAILFVTAGDNPERLRSEATFAHLCGVAPLEASSGKTNHHRLNRGGVRYGNQALWRIVTVRLVSDPRTRVYMERRTEEGMSKLEVIRILKRYVAREAYRQQPALDLSGPSVVCQPSTQPP